MSPNPIKTIWLNPRETVRRIVSENPNHHVILLVCLAGISETLDRASVKNAGDKMPMLGIVALVCLFGPLGGLLNLWITSHLIRWTGSWIGGTSPRQHLRTAIGWSALPLVVGLPLWIPKLMIFGSEMFTEETPRLDANSFLWIPFATIGVAEVVLGIWSFWLLCHTVAEVQGFASAWRGFGNLLLAGVVFIVPLILIVFAVVAISMA